MPCQQVRQGDAGATFRLTVVDCNAVLDVSQATAQQLLLRKPSGSVIACPTAFTTDGKNGQVEYTTVATDLDQVGLWFGQLAVTLPTGACSSSQFSFTVAEAMIAPPPTDVTATQALPATVNLKFYRGDSWVQVFRLRYGDTPVDLTDAQLMCWAVTGSVSVPLTALAIAPPTDGLVSLSNPSGGPLPSGTYQYDLQTVIDGAIRTWVRGQLVITDDVTKA